jgi:hypothetical protein
LLALATLGPTRQSSGPARKAAQAGYFYVMRLNSRLSPLLLLALFCMGVIFPVMAADISQENILMTFSKYEALNADFKSSVESGYGNSGKSYEALRKEVEIFVEDPFEKSLRGATHRLCRYKDRELLKALFRVTAATSNSASESPAWSLGEIFVCQSDFVAKEFRVLPLPTQQQLYGTLEFGFENVASRKPTTRTRVIALRNKLHSLAPEAKQ